MRGMTRDSSPMRIRPAQAEDQGAIVQMVRAERLNPTDLQWQRFTVAEDGQGLAGVVQIRRHADGSRELGSFAVRPDVRERGIGAALVDRALATQPGTVHLITRPALAAYVSRWGFEWIPPSQASPAVRRGRLVGCAAGVLFGLLKGRRPTPLAIYARNAPSEQV